MLKRWNLSSILIILSHNSFESKTSHVHFTSASFKLKKKERERSYKNNPEHFKTKYMYYWCSLVDCIRNILGDLPKTKLKTRSDWIHGTRLKFHKSSTWHISFTTCVIVIHTNPLRLKIWISILFPCNINLMFIIDHHHNLHFLGFIWWVFSGIQRREGIARKE